MDFSSAYNLIVSLLANDWEVIFLIFGAILSLKWLNVVDSGVSAKIANLVSSALASGLLNNMTAANGLKLVVFSAGSALVYHLYQKVVAPAVAKLVADIRPK